MNNKKAILITGSSSGFGRLTAEALAEAEHTVFATMRGIETKNARVAQSLRRQADDNGWDLHVLDLDVTDEASIQTAVQTAREQAGRIDVLINNAGYGGFGWTEGFETQQIRDMFEVNFFGVLSLNRAILPLMRRQKEGLLIHVSSVLGRLPWTYMSGYVASKYALEGYVDSVNMELNRFGIQALLVEPGLFGTSFGEKMFSPTDAERLASYGEWTGAPQEQLAEVVEMINSPDFQQPVEVAEGIKQLIETPKADRPLRTILDRTPFSEAVKQINQTSQKAMSDLQAILAKA